MGWNLLFASGSHCFWLRRILLRKCQVLFHVMFSIWKIWNGRCLVIVLVLRGAVAFFFPAIPLCVSCLMLVCWDCGSYLNFEMDLRRGGHFNFALLFFPGWSAGYHGYVSSSTKPKSITLSSTAASLWYKQRDSSEAWVDDNGGGCHTANRPNDCLLCTAYCRASMWDFEPSKELSWRYRRWDCKHPYSHACR